VDIRQIQKIDDAYELLKQDLEDTFESCRKVDDKVDSQVKLPAMKLNKLNVFKFQEQKISVRLCTELASSLFTFREGIARTSG